ncbi:MAG: hypothetical protein ABIA47_01875 [bacterium]
MYVTCSKGSNGRCANRFHDKDSVGDDGLCKLGRAWRQHATPCVLCGAPVPEHLGVRVHPTVATMFPREVIDLENPKNMRVYVGMRFRSGISGDLDKIRQGCRERFCEKCAERISQGINVGNPDRTGLVHVGGDFVPLFVPYDFMRQAREAILVVARKAQEGGKIDKAFTRTMPDGFILTECVVHVNARDFCLCGGWHDYNQMPAIRREGWPMAFGFGPECAQVVQAAGMAMPRSLKSWIDEMSASTNATRSDSRGNEMAAN